MNMMFDFVWLAEAPPWLGLVGRWTALLSLAWGAHLVLAGGNGNPRWRVALWRSVAVGLAAIAVLMAAPPVLTWRLPRVESESTAEPRLVAVERERVPVPASVPTPTPVLHVDRAGGVSSLAEMAAVEAPQRVGAASVLGAGLLMTWLAGVAVLAGRLAWSGRRLARVVRDAAEAPGSVIEEARAIAARLGVRGRRVRVLQSAKVLTPCLAGSRQPVILLPAWSCQESQRADLPAILAHELAHARGRDLIWNDVWHGVAVVLWFHPLVWKVRATHAAACDSVCDAVASDLLGDTSLYVRTLARLALQVSGPASAFALTMARTSDVRRRIEALQRNVSSSPLPRRSAMPALLALGLLVVLLGGLGFTTAPASASADEHEPAKAETSPIERQPEVAGPVRNSRIVLRVVADQTGEPLEGASIEFAKRVDQQWSRGTIETDWDGAATVEWPAGKTLNELMLKIRKQKYVRYCVNWSDETHPLRLPESKEIRLETGVPIGGVVRDDTGRPIAGVTVTIGAVPLETESSRFGFVIGTVTADDQGRWQFDEAPEDLSRVRVSSSPVGYFQWDSPRQEGRERVIVLKKGMTVKGRVVNGAGEPVEGAVAIVESKARVFEPNSGKTIHVNGLVRIVGGETWGVNRKLGKTDERGEFVLEGCRPGPAIVTVQTVHIDGFAPALHEFQIRPEGETAAPEVRLEPGAVLRLKVVDRAGKPIAGAKWAPDTWRGCRALFFRAKTDVEGRSVWNDAPRDSVQITVACDGYMRRHLVPLVASAEEHVITLDPELSISGRVTDAETGQPISQFRVVQGIQEFHGIEQTYWLSQESFDAEGGSYSTRFTFPRRAHFVRIEAPGYKSANSRAFHSDEGRQTLDFALTRDSSR